MSRNWPDAGGGRRVVDRGKSMNQDPELKGAPFTQQVLLEAPPGTVLGSGNMCDANNKKPSLPWGWLAFWWSGVAGTRSLKLS